MTIKLTDTIPSREYESSKGSGGYWDISDYFL